MAACPTPCCVAPATAVLLSADVPLLLEASVCRGCVEPEAGLGVTACLYSLCRSVSRG